MPLAFICDIVDGMRRLLGLTLLAYSIGSTANAVPARTTIPANFLSEMQLSLWSEFIPYPQVEASLDSLKNLHIQLRVAVSQEGLRQTGFELQEFCSLYRAGEQRGISISPWILLNEKNQYWFNKSNFPAARDFTEELLTRLQNECGLQPRSVTFDLEPPKHLSLKLLAHDTSGDSLSEAVQNYNSLVRSLNKRGIAVHAVTSQFVLNEGKRDPTKIQDAKSIPFRGGDWNEVSFMLYKAELEDKVKFLGRRLSFSSGSTYEYASRAVKAYAPVYGLEHISISLGEVGPVQYPVPFMGLQKPYELYFELRAVYAAGIRKAEVYSLDGFLAMEGELQNNLSAWLFPSIEERQYYEQRYPQEKHENVNAPSFFAVRGLDFLFGLFLHHN